MKSERAKLLARKILDALVDGGYVALMESRQSIQEVASRIISEAIDGVDPPRPTRRKSNVRLRGGLQTTLSRTTGG